MPGPDLQSLVLKTSPTKLTVESDHHLTPVHVLLVQHTPQLVQHQHPPELDHLAPELDSHNTGSNDLFPDQLTPELSHQSRDHVQHSPAQVDLDHLHPELNCHSPDQVAGSLS